MNNSNYKLEPVRKYEKYLPNSEGIQEKNTYKCDVCGEIDDIDLLIHLVKVNGKDTIFQFKSF